MATKDLTEGKPLKIISLFMLPMFIGNIFQQLYNFFDALIVGRFIGIDALAAVGATVPMIFLIISFIFASTQGFSIVTAQNFGAKEFEKVKKSAAASFILSGILTVVMTLISAPFTKNFLLLLNTPKDIFNDAYIYLFIMFAGIFATVFYNVASNLIRALGDSKTPLYFLIFSSFLNIFLDILFIKGFNMGIMGAGLATVASQGVSTVLCLLFMYMKFPLLRLKKEDWKVDREFLFEHVKIGFPMGLQMSILTIGIFFVQYALNGLGSTAIAAFTTAIRVEQIFSQAYIALGAAMATFSAQNFGIKKISRIRKGAKDSIIIVIIINIFSGIFLKLFGAKAIGLFMTNPVQEVIELGVEYLNIIVLFFSFLGILMIFRNILQGMGNAVIPLFSGIAELIMRAIGAIVLVYYFGYKGICYATPLAWIAGALVLFVGFRIDLRMKKRKLKKG